MDNLLAGSLSIVAEVLMKMTLDMKRDVVKKPESSKQALYTSPLIGLPLPVCRPFTLNGNNPHKEREVMSIPRNGNVLHSLTCQLKFLHASAWFTNDVLVYQQKTHSYQNICCICEQFGTH